LRRLAAAFVACIPLALLIGCGEKSEPDFSGPGAEPPAAEPLAPIAGDWTGTLSQRGVPPFTVRVTIASADSPAANPVSYTGIDCSGTWDFQSRSGSAYSFREVIDRGKGGRCKGAGEVTVTPQGDRLAYRFRGGGVTSRGVLSRSG
jgi:hypothetical protein